MKPRKTAKKPARAKPARAKAARPRPVALKAHAIRVQTFEDLDIGRERVTSNECWVPDEERVGGKRVYRDLRIRGERVTSNECYDVKEK
jgi:hypothetical protein